MAKVYTRPSFTHDCDACEYLGTYMEHDLYVCFSEATKRFTYIARYGSEPEAYASLPASIVKLLPKDSHDVLVKALDLHVAHLGYALEA